MFYDSTIQAVQETADALLEDCDQTIEPLQGKKNRRSLHRVTPPPKRLLRRLALPEGPART